MLGYALFAEGSELPDLIKFNRLPIEAPPRTLIDNWCYAVEGISSRLDRDSDYVSDQASIIRIDVNFRRSFPGLRVNYAYCDDTRRD